MSDEKDWPDGWRWYRNPPSHGGEPYLAHPHDCELTLANLRTLVAFHGLALVPAADVPTPEERAVLEAIERAYKRLGDDPAYYHVTHETIGEMLGGRYDYGFASAANAMLARRSAKAGAK